MTIYEAYENYVTDLRGIYDLREAETITDWIFEDIAGISRMERINGRSKELDIAFVSPLKKAMELLLQHTPVQYVLGEAWFYKLKFIVNKNVLIPRPETEELVFWVIKDITTGIQDRVFSDTLPKVLKILDIGTGSGCIAIALKKEVPQCSVEAIDVSNDALSLARMNANNNNVQIEFKQLNFLDPEQRDQLSGFDLIVSNPPYISALEMNSLPKNVVDHEPRIALFPDHEDPMIFYRHIAEFATSNLKQNGIVYVEIHEQNSHTAMQIFEKRNFTCEARKDMFGRDRMLKCLRS